MSWFARSICNIFKPDNNDDVEEEEDDDNKHYVVSKNTIIFTDKKHEQQVSDDNSRQYRGIGVKDDLSEITKTLSRQFRGVASLISCNERSDSSEPEAISGVRRDFAEIGERFRSGILKVSNDIDVSAITKLASDFLQMDSEDDNEDSSDGYGDGAVGVSDDVVAFAGDIAMHPETWLDFPLPENEDDGEDFDLSDAQQEHVLAVERLAPRLSALRIELCPNYMTESSFWKIYFVLLHPRLERDAAELLSTPKIMKARALLAHELKNRSYSENTSDSKSKLFPLEVSAIESVKHPIKSDDILIVDKSVIQEDSHQGKYKDDLLKEESSEIVINRVAIPIEDNDDVSFSDDDDYDDDDDGNIPIHYKKAAYTSDSSTKESRSWVQFNGSSTDSGKDSNSLGKVSIHNSGTKESNDWLDVVDIDLA
ncbi:hypothetical protein R6Q59_013954 [Mikania micrantha]|uniref:BSD domain-containing protein n=1 Tax=Mikania micrantha TaxID=192012 RepID=A0A5N6P5G4_9ASTR|nr:hypothetical protein E3N88_12420 [Mikania micrantha]